MGKGKKKRAAASEDAALGNMSGEGIVSHTEGRDTVTPAISNEKEMTNSENGNITALIGKSSTGKASNTSISSSTDHQRTKETQNSKRQAQDLLTASSLTISRNKHTRYISAFHGPWLQLPHEILETLAHSNYLSPRPRQTDPGVLYDLIKIRSLVDEASDLAVRAQNGTASSALGSDNGLPGGALGLSYRGVGGNAKLSPERKYRMREMATHKLSAAYKLDEIAASVATMQGASALDNVGQLVLQRNASNVDAKYVHYFHEKIPSRMMSESTPLQPLNEIIASHPGHAAPFRTRALMKIFKEDHAGAAQDLTEALTLCRLDMAKHRAGRNQLVTMKTVREENEKRKIWTRDWMNENRVMEEDQPRGMEMQLLFQRGNQYLTIACRHIRLALENFRRAQRAKASADQDMADNGAANEANPHGTAAGAEAYKRALEAREIIRKNAKRALRDYTTFFSRLDYAHAPRSAKNDDVLSRESLVDEFEDFGVGAGGDGAAQSQAPSQLQPQSQALVRGQQQKYNGYHHHQNGDFPSAATTATELTIYEMSALLSPSPPADIPPFPIHASPPATTKSSVSSHNSKTNIRIQHDETLTYHPLLPETLHAFLLTHCLLQTPPTTLLRHAYNVARLVRLADGYPFFLAARSPARSDWCEILRKTNNWIGLRGLEGAGNSGSVSNGIQQTNGHARDGAGTLPARIRTAHASHKGSGSNSGSAWWEELCRITPVSTPTSDSTPSRPQPNNHERMPHMDTNDVFTNDSNGLGHSNARTTKSTAKRDTQFNGAVTQSPVDRSSSSPTSTNTSHPPPTTSPMKLPNETSSEKRTRIHSRAIIESLADECVVDDETFERAVTARERRAWKDDLQLPSDDAEEEDGVKGEVKSEDKGKDQDEGERERRIYSLQLESAGITNNTRTAKTGVSAKNLNIKDEAAQLKKAPTIQRNTHGIRDEVPPRPTAIVSSSETASSPQPLSPPPATSSAPPPVPITIAKDEEYLIGTERAECIATWILEAPSVIGCVDGNGIVGVGKRKKGKGKRKDKDKDKAKENENENEKDVGI